MAAAAHTSVPCSRPFHPASPSASRSPRSIWPTRRTPFKAHSFMINVPTPHLPSLKSGSCPGWPCLFSWMLEACPWLHPCATGSQEAWEGWARLKDHPSGSTAGVSEPSGASDWSSSGLTPAPHWGVKGWSILMDSLSKTTCK